MQNKNNIEKPSLGTLSLILLTIGSVISIRNLPMAALFGSSLIFYFLIAGIAFLIPSGLVSAELASTWTEEGGVYTWAKQAFGNKIAFLAIWSWWICSVVWYPAILAFIAGTIAFVISPELANNKIYMFLTCNICFWSITCLNLFNIRISAIFGIFCSIVGLIIPMTLIIGLGLFWFFTAHHLEINFSITNLLPHVGYIDQYVALTGIVLSFSGMELTAAHINDVNQPQKKYPRALIVSAIIILITMIAGSLSIAIVVPNNQLSLISGLMQAMDYYLQPFHLVWIEPVIALLIVFGTVGGLNSWVLASSRVLQCAMKKIPVPSFLIYENKMLMPVGLLLTKACIALVISSLFLLMPSVNSCYWLFMSLASQIYMIMYLIVFVAAIVLRYKFPTKQRLFTIPGGKVGLYTVCGLGIVSALFTIGIGFVCPANIHCSQTLYAVLLVIGIVFFCLPPFLLPTKPEISDMSKELLMSELLSS